MKSIYSEQYRQIGLKIAYYRKLRGLTQEELTKRDIAFHARIAQCTGNPVIVELLSAIREVIARNVEEGHSFDANNEYHGEMIDAIAKQDPEKAKNVMQRYFDSVYEALGI